MFDIALVAELSPTPFAELGAAYDVVHDEARRYAVVVSSFEESCCGAEPMSRLPSFRASLYSADLQERIAVLPALRFPVNDISIHPTRTVVALATGSYDGGYSFEGQLLLWDWQRDEVIDVLAGGREIWRVWFTADGALELGLRPTSEEAVPDAWHVMFAGTLTDLRPYRELGIEKNSPDPRIAGFVQLDRESLPPDTPDWRHAKERWQRAFGSRTPEYRSNVQDVAWSDDGHVLAVHLGCELEAWDRQGHRVLDVRGTHTGVKLLRSKHGIYVHLRLLETPPNASPFYRTTLAQLEGTTLSEIRTFIGSKAFSIDAGGRILARDTDHPKEPDRVLAPDGRDLLVRHLVDAARRNYDLCLDHGDALYLLRDTPAIPRPRKALFRLDVDNKLRECWLWDTGDEPYTCNHAVLLPDGDVARAFAVDNVQLQPAHLEIRVLESGALRHTYPLSAAPTCLARNEQYLFYALSDGMIGAIDFRTGERVFERAFHVDGVPVIALCLAARGDDLACGTRDGRVLLLRVRS